MAQRTRGSQRRITRRSFVQSATALAGGLGAGSLLGCASPGPARQSPPPVEGAPPPVHVLGGDRIRVGLIGCGGRGTGAATDCSKADAGVVITALGDVFQERIDKCREGLAPLGAQCAVSDDACFTGFEAHRQVIASGVDLVILATPPAFRPPMLRAAVEAGCHVFMEKPVGVDGFGIREVFAAHEIAAQKRLGVVAGTQRRHQTPYLDCIRRIHEGQIGEVVAGYAYWNGGELWMNPRKPEWSDMEWQLRNWLYFTWLSGDHIVEQHVHNLDVMNWVLRGHPLKCSGMGGRQKRTDPAYGHIFDHFALEYEYEGGARVTSFCRQQDNCHNNVSEFVIGTKGRSNCCTRIDAAQEWDWDGEYRNAYEQEHVDLIASIRAGRPLNEARQVGESTLTAIMGRMAAYSGKEVTWEQALNSEHRLMPEKLEFGALSVPPVAIPGKTEIELA